MVFDALCCACSLAELREHLVGGTIREVYQPERLELWLRVFAQGRERYLCLSASAQFARAHLAPSPPRAQERTFPFVLFARKHLLGAAVCGVSQVAFDRIIKFEVQPTNPRLADPVRTIVVEIMGKHSNIILLNNVGTILEAAKHITADLSRVRTVLPHVDYIRPPFRDRLDPAALDEERARELIAQAPSDQPVGKWLRDAVDGMSEVLLKELLFRAGADPETPAQELGEQTRALARVLAELGQILRERAFSPTRHVRADGSELVYPLPLHHLQREARLERIPLFGPALAFAVEAERANMALAAQRAALARRIAREIDRRRERLARLERDVARREEARQLRRRAELLLAHMRLVPVGAREVTLPNIFLEGAPPETIPLNPELSPQANAERLFRRSKSLERAAERAPERMRAVAEEIALLERAAAEVAQAQDAGELRALARRLEERGLLRREQQPKQRAGRGVRAEDRLLRLLSPDGYQVVVGRSAAESDEILRHIADPDDLWFHARDIRGGHVIVRTNRQPERVPESTVEFAAQIAAYYSKARHSRLVPVDYTLKKHVRRARGGAPGLHIYDQAKTVIVEPRPPASEEQSAQ